MLMIYKFTRLVKKNIIIFNLIIFFIASLFFYLNYNNFDNYKTYVEFKFQERLFFSKIVDEENQLNFNKIKYFLNDVEFNKITYGILDLYLEDPANKVDVEINYRDEKLIFSFKTIERKIFNIALKKNNNQQNNSEKNIKLIKNFVDELLIKYHSRIGETLDYDIIFYENLLENYLNSESSLTNKSNDILQKSGAINELKQLRKLLDLKTDLVIISQYNNKFRKISLSSVEYWVSFIILLFLFNILTRYSDKIIK